MKDWVVTARAYLQAFADWTEKHPGLGTWFGAAGAIIAILAAWGLARAEYNRVQRVEAARFNSEIALYLRREGVRQIDERSDRVQAADEGTHPRRHGRSDQTGPPGA